MYLLDTNVVSELRKKKSGKIDPNVLNWSDQFSINSFFLSAITILELELGTLLAERRDPAQGTVLRHWIHHTVLPTFNNQILVIDTKVAQRAAKLHIPNPAPERDALIAATAIIHSMILVTRNVKDFSGLAIDIINPWEFH